MTDRHRPFARTHEAAQEAEAKRAGTTGASRRTFERTTAVSPEAPPGVMPHHAYEAASTFAVDRLERRPMPRRRLPWLLTGFVVVIFGQIVWWAYHEVDSEQPVATVLNEAPPITEVAFEPSVADPLDAVAAFWPPIPQPRPADGRATISGGPPKPVLKPR